MSKENRADIPAFIPLLGAEAFRERIPAELDALKARGTRQFAISAGTQALDPDWDRFIRLCASEAAARELGMWLHLGDLYAASANDVHDPALQGKFIEVEWLARADIDLLFFEPGQFLVAAKMQGGRVAKTRVIPDLHLLRALDASWHVFNCRIKRDQRHFDVLSSDAVAYFRRLWIEEGLRQVPREIGSVVRGIFAGQPCACWAEEDGARRIPYTEKLFQSFEDRFKYSAVENIPYLFFPGEGARSFRADFWSHVSDLLTENYHGTLSKWCSRQGLVYAGRASCEDTLRTQVRCQGNMFGALRLMGLPSIEHSGAGDHAGPLSIVGHKIASSYAHQSGRPRVASIISQSAGTGLKRGVDWQLELGVDAFVAESSGPDESLDLQAYVERISGFLDGGRHLSRILILYPLTGLYAAYQPDRNTEEFEAIESVLNSLCQRLMRFQLDYDLADLPALDEATTSNGKITLGDEKYNLLIVPYTPYMRPDEYAAIGRIAKEVETYFFYRSMEPMPANEPSQANRVRFIPTEDLPGFVMRLRHSIDDGIHVTGHGREDILLLQREFEDRIAAFLVNRSEHERTIVTRFAGQVRPTLIDPVTGEELPVETQQVGHKTEVTLHFGPHASLLLTIPTGG